MRYDFILFYFILSILFFSIFIVSIHLQSPIFHIIDLLCYITYEELYCYSS